MQKKELPTGCRNKLMGLWAVTARYGNRGRREGWRRRKAGML